MMIRDETTQPSGGSMLNTYLDELATRGVADWQDLDPSLAATVDYVHGLDDRSAPAPGLMEQTWRELMGTIGVEQGRWDSIGVPVGGDSPVSATSWRLGERFALARWLGGGIAAAVLIAVILVGYVTMRLAQTGGDDRPTMSAALQAATAEAPQGPALAGCTTSLRPEGTVAALVGTLPTVMRLLPRQNDDPVHFEQPIAPVDGDTLLHDRPTASDEIVGGLNDTLAELTACRFYLSGPNGRVDLDGRYYALFSDDYFRGELAGYREAGLELTISRFWLLSTAVTVNEAYELWDGRVAAVVELGPLPNHPDWRWIVIFTKVGDRWLVDEAGYGTFPSLVPASPEAVAATPLPPALLEIALFDAVPAEPATTPEADFPLTHRIKADGAVILRTEPTMESDGQLVLPFGESLRWLGNEEVDENGETWMQFETSTGAVGWIREVDVGLPEDVPAVTTSCDALTARPVPCGEGFQRYGPYNYNEFLANTDLTIRLHNTGTHSHRFVLEELGVDIELAPAESAEFTFNAPVGSYLFLIYEGTSSEPSGGGVFVVVVDEQQRGRG